MSLILQIETATASCSVALARDGNILAVKQVNERNIHAEVITLFIDELITSSGIQTQHLDAVAVSCGPGSYTGLRIGISTAKGLCFAIDKPLIAIETLEAMAFGAISITKNTMKSDFLLCPMIDARRMEVFTAVFNYNGDKIKATAAEVINEYSFNELLKGNSILFFGDGAEKCRTFFKGNPNARFLTGFVNSASYLTQKALEKFRNKDFENIALFEPFYLKDFMMVKKAV